MAAIHSVENERILKIAIISGKENGSPRVLATTLDQFIKSTNNLSRIFYKAKALKRLLKKANVRYNKWIWFLYKLFNTLNDKSFFSRLKGFDAVIICDWTPNGFYKNTYNIKKFKDIIGGKPVLYYAVQYLGNSPTLIKKLKDGGHPLTERYDWHLAVSDITEIRQNPSPPWSKVGLYLKSTGLRPKKREKFLAVVDFVRKGYENYRAVQIQVLEELKIPYISLEKEYSIEEIRQIYSEASLFFIQFPEAFGMPIAECLACGTYICTPDSSWPMAWRLNNSPKVHGPGILPECFVVYDGEKDLAEQITRIKNDFDPEKTPQKVFDIFLHYYSDFYSGNQEALKNVLDLIRYRKLPSNWIGK